MGQALVLMGKCKDGDWEYVDCLDAESTLRPQPEQEEALEVDKRYMEGEYKLAFGDEWTFKWEKGEGTW
jgi:hypothetical protein